MSPVYNQPSRMVSAVASGLFQYPAVISGPYIVTSPVCPGATSLPWSSRILSSSVGTGWPTEVGRSTASCPPMAVATDDDSVSPYALVVVFTLGNVSRTLRCNSSADGEPPKATLTTDDVS